ncbi:HNH endonuclease [Budvicia aquatica]|uniref:HNH endonuclease n=1 Tax=Budvicia aquatica TaxID=82979 RepID=UPI0035A2578F
MTPEPTISSPNGDVAIPDNPTAYSVAYEMQLDPVDYGKSRKIHFGRGNKSLDEAMNNDPDFADKMEELMPGVQESVAKKGKRETPDGWTWAHASTTTEHGQTGIVRLVPSVQHTSGSPFWGTRPR